jgi:hypothetical protein
LRSLVIDLHLRHVGRRQVASLQPPLRRVQRPREELCGLRQHLRALLRELEIEVRAAHGGELLAQHVERIVHRGALQPRSGIEPELALVAALEGLVDAEHRVGLGTGGDRGAVDRESGVGTRAGDHALRFGRFHGAAGRLQFAIVLREQRLGFRQREVARMRHAGAGRESEPHDSQNSVHSGTCQVHEWLATLRPQP